MQISESDVTVVTHGWIREWENFYHLASIKSNYAIQNLCNIGIFLISDLQFILDSGMLNITIDDENIHTMQPCQFSDQSSNT